MEVGDRGREESKVVIKGGRKREVGREWGMYRWVGKEGPG